MMIFVFAGPSVFAGDAELYPRITFLPPVSLGDVYRLLNQKPKAIGIIDGYFERSPAVSHKEILLALSSGVHVFGAASMGALRAAELAPFGMVGIGKIFESYRDGLIEDDDEVAVAHGPQAEGYRMASEPMVNIRATVERALRERILTRPAADHVLSAAKSLYYPLRNYPAILEGAQISEKTGARFLQWLVNGKVDQKREDAQALLALLTSGRTARLGRKRVSFPFHRTQMWDFAMQNVKGEHGSTIHPRG